MVRRYYVKGSGAPEDAAKIEQALADHFGADAVAEVALGQARIDLAESCDPQIVSFIIEGFGYRVERVEDAGGAEQNPEAAP